MFYVIDGKIVESEVETIKAKLVDFHIVAREIAAKLCTNGSRDTREVFEVLHQRFNLLPAKKY